MRSFVRTILRLPQAIILGFIGAVLVVIGGFISVIGIIVAWAMQAILLWIAEFIVEIAAINVTFDLNRGIWVLMFLTLWLSITISELRAGTVSNNLKKARNEE